MTPRSPQCSALEAPRGGRVQRRASERDPTPKLAWRAGALWVAGILGVVGMIAHQHLTDRRETAARQARYASLLAQDVWDLDAETAARAVRVIADAECYTQVSIVLPDGRAFVRHE